MSARGAVKDAPAAGAALNLDALGAARHPQVNLLPPEVNSRRALGRVKRTLGLAILFVVLLAGAAFAYATLDARQAERELQAKQDEVAQLVAEQQKYAEVPQVKREIADAESARAFGLSTEVMWRDYIQAIQAVEPAGWSMTSFTTTMPTPGSPMGTTADLLATPGVGTISFHGRASTMPDVSAWLDALNSITGFHDATFTTATVGQDNGPMYYETESTVQVDTSAFANRFAAEDGAK